MADSQYYIPNDVSVVFLECKDAFEKLSEKEMLYSHYISRASWYGGLITLMQVSPESPLVFVLLQKLFREQSLDELKAVAKQAGWTDDDFKSLLVFCTAFYHNSGNYKGFGDTKIVPNLNKEKLEALVKGSKAWSTDPERMEFLWNNCGDAIFSLTDREKQLGLCEKGITKYLSSNITEEDGKLLGKFLEHENISPYNTRAFKVTKNGKPCFEIRMAAIEEGADPAKEFEGHQFVVTRGDYQALLQLVCQELNKAQEHVANELEQNMLMHYVNSFRTGKIDEHKEGSRFWVKNKAPSIELYVGFIETYRDPLGSRGEFESFVACVNRERTKKFTVLVNSAKEFLPRLPWPSTFEKDKFLQPDYTDLDILTFAGSGMPIGINIPNYDDIKQNEGFKNVTLTNVVEIARKTTTEKELPFLSQEDKDFIKDHRMGALEVQVGLHELLGHGSGKLFVRKKDGSFNFDVDKVTDPLTGKKIMGWYEEGQSYDSKFGSIASSYEECRAECVGMYLCFEEEILKIFGHEGESAQKVVSTLWIDMIFAGAAKALEMYQPSAKTWLQAHSQARFVILRVLLEAGNGLLTLEECQDKDGEPDLLITVDRSKIPTVGRKAIGDFLLKLQLYKATGDIASARQMYDHYSSVDNEGAHPFLKWRDIVLAKKVPRKLIVQPNTRLNDGTVELVEYPSSPEGMIQSWVDRFNGETQLDHLLIDLWKRDRKYFS